jgi:hypothetical protein
MYSTPPPQGFPLSHFWNPCLKAGLVGPDREHLVSPFILHCNELVVLSQYIAETLFSVQLTVACVSTVDHIRYHRYIYFASTLRSSDNISGCWIAVTICISGTCHNTFTSFPPLFVKTMSCVISLSSGGRVSACIFQLLFKQSSRSQWPCGLRNKMS